MFIKFINFLKEKGWFPYVVGFAIGCVLSFIVIPSLSINSASRTEIEKSVKAEYEQRFAEEQASFKEALSSKEKEIEAASNESFQKEQNYKRQLASLMSEVSSLSQSSETEEVEIHHADGSWEKRKVSKSTVDQLNQKIAEVKEQTEQSYKEELAKQQSSHEKEMSSIKESLAQQQSKSSEILSSKEEEIKKLKESSTTVVANEKKFGVGVGYNSDLLYKLHVDYTVWGPVYIGGDVDTNKADKNRAAVSMGIRF